MDTSGIHWKVICEHLLNRIGEVLGLNIAPSQLRITHGQLRFLSKYFLQNGENLVHGAQIYSSYLQENDDRFIQEIEDQNWARTLLTFQFTQEAVEFLFPNEFKEIMNHLVELLVFDAITGNNDRHFYNWAVITHVEGMKSPEFAPIYDSARGLFWNIGEQVIERKFYVKKGENLEINLHNLETYINSCRPKIGWEGWNEVDEINHFQLIANINKHYPLYQDICLRLIQNIHLQSILNLLDEEFSTFFTTNRLEHVGKFNFIFKSF